MYNSHSLQIACLGGLVVSFGAALAAPFFLFPVAFVGAITTGWLLTQSKGLPRKSDIAARVYRQKFREKLAREFEGQANQLQLTLAQREEIIQAKALELQQKWAQLEQWQSFLVQTETKFSTALHEQEQYYLQLIQQVEQNAIAEIDMRQRSILQLQQKLMGTVNRPDPRQGFAAWIAQLLLQALEQNEVFCQLKGFYKIPGLRDVSVWVELQTGTPARKLETISKEVGTWVKMGEPTVLWDADECVYEFRFAPAVENFDTSYEILVDSESELPAISEPEDKDWFTKIICDSKSTHYMIHGPSGAGKSVLVDNLICAGGDYLITQTQKQVRVFIVDPKFPDSEWTYRGERLKPQYRRWDGAIEGVLAMQQEVNDRLDAAAVVAESIPEHLYSDVSYELPVPDRPIDFWVIDEAAALHSLYKEQCSAAYRAVLWVGRSSMVRSILIGQNPNPSNYGLQIPDLGNCTRFYLGITGLEALDRFVKPPREIKAQLKAQIYARLRQVKAKKLSGVANPPEQYFAMVVTSFQNPFIAQLPAPKAFVGSAVVLPQTDNLLDLVQQAQSETLPQYLQDLLSYAQQKNDWITGSEFRQNRNHYKSVKFQQVNLWLEELEKRGFGQCDRTAQTIKFIYTKE
jgi:hypothetical protein